MEFIKFVRLYFAFFLIYSFTSAHSYPFDTKWNWDHINTDDILFPKDFLWGSATSEFQNSGANLCRNSNWSEWEKSLDHNQNPRIKGGNLSGDSCDHWNRYGEDITLMKHFGLTSYRFSVDWSLIEPEDGVIDYEVLEHYIDLCQELKANNITPMITLHHFNHPKWFEDMGGFEKEENINYFVDFATLVFEHLGSEVSLWCTINEPGIYAFMGYYLGGFPPGKMNTGLTAIVLKNLLKAHCQVYHTLKALPGGDEAQIGLVHNVLKFRPYSSWNPIELISCYLLSFITHDAILEFLKTGYFNFNFPFYVDVAFEDKEAPNSYDFIGINFYSDPLIMLQWDFYEPLISTCYSKEEMSDAEYRLYPQGIYHAIVECSELGVPIYITENGIADAQDNRRGTFIKRYIFAISQALKDGYDVKGYFYWTLIDNFEWAEGYSLKFGLFEFDYETKERTMREGARSYKDIIEGWRDYWSLELSHCFSP